MRHAAFALLAVLVLTVLVAAAPVGAQTDAPGHVEIPLELYNQLVAQASDPTQPPRPVPVPYALGRARVEVRVGEAGGRPSAAVRVVLQVRVLEDEWMLVPILPPGTPVESVTVAGAAIELVPTPAGLMWGVNKAGSYEVEIRYRSDAARTEGGVSLALPVPAAAAIQLEATLPGTDLDVAVIPSAGTTTSKNGNTTVVRATVPTTRGIQLAWRVGAERGHALSRATYRGELQGRAVAWTGEVQVELLADEPLTLPLLPRSVTLSHLEVDGAASPILVEDGRFATLVKGRGVHTVTVGFLTAVEQGDGPPRVGLAIPPVPVSSVELTLPGKKEVTVEPSANVSHQSRGKGAGETTVATAFVPLSEHVTLAWSEAVPEDVRAELRLNASLYHAVHAEEGVLLVDALVAASVTRGETNTLRLLLPDGVQLNRVGSPSGAVADWQVTAGKDGERQATVFFDRQMGGDFVVEVGYDLSLKSGDEAPPVAVPLLAVLGSHRQRGMVALLQSKELALEPVDDAGLTRVGENQLPAFVRQAIAMTVAHTYKYVETPPRLDVQAKVPERALGRFDAVVDTLVSLGDVSMKGSASVEVSVKSGRILDLGLELPPDVSLLSLTGPSVRQHSAPDDGGRIAVEFTQEMEGQFRLEVAWERLLEGGGEAFMVPALAVAGAEVEEGRLAVEALSAVEVEAESAERLMPLDVSELPQQLVLRTTNPILLAYKYVRATPPPELRLRLERHRVLEVEEAAIDRADYKTLFTKDGLAVTTARFWVRNSREQFLRVDLPEEAEVWSAFVDGRPEKPAAGDDGDGPRQVLIKIVHSTEGFPVELVYTTPSERVDGVFGSAIRGRLPHPDILVTESRWEVFVPAGLAYREPETNMEVVSSAEPQAAADMAAERTLAGGAKVIEPLRLHVPSAGVRYVFSKLYANQSAAEPASFELPWVTPLGRLVRGVATLLAVALAAFLAVKLVRRFGTSGGFNWSKIT